MVSYAENKSDLIVLIGSGSWNTESFDMAAQRVDD